jgi:hypothetical protein
MNAQLRFDGEAVYVPVIHNDCVIWISSRRRAAPLWGIHVPSIENAATFADVIVVDEYDRVIDYVEQKKEQE